MKKILSLLFLLLIISPVIAVDSVKTSIVSTPYIDISIWYFITIMGLLLMFVSNITSKEQNAPLWALLAIFFTFPSAYFANMLSRTTIAQSTASDGTVSVAIQQTVFHPEWLNVILGIVFVLSFINVWYIWTKKPIEKPTRQEID
jgi:hypothetical protein